MRNASEPSVPSGRLELAPTVVLGALGTLVTIGQMALLSAIVGRVLEGKQHLLQVLPALGVLLGTIVVRAILGWREEVSAQLAALSITSSLRERLIAHLLLLGPASLQHERSGDLATTAGEGVDRLTPYYQRYVPLRSLSVIVPALIILAVLKVDLLSALVLLATAPVIPLLMVLIGSYSQVDVQRNWLALARLGAQFLDTLQGLPTLLLFGRGDAAGERVRAASAAYAERTLRVLRVAFLSGMVLDIMIGMAIGLVAVVVAIQLLAGLLPLSSALLVLLLTPECYRPLREMGAQRHVAMEGQAAGQRIAELLNMPAPGQLLRPSTTPAGHPDRASVGGDTIAAPLAVAFSGVSYCYRDKNGDRVDGGEGPALADVSLTLPAGTSTALVGRSGAGKSTLIHLLLRFLEPDHGAITVNGTNLRDLPPHLWRAHVALVPQRPHLFTGSIAHNLRLARPDASQADLEWAAEQAGAAEFIVRLPGGYGAPVGEQGALLSAGQVQRLAIARAFLKDAPLLILDEPTSALDPESEGHIRRSLERLMAGRTVLIVAHRRNTILASHQIAVLEHGRLMEIGGHGELLERGGAYAGLMGDRGGAKIEAPATVSDRTGPRLRSAALPPLAVAARSHPAPPPATRAPDPAPLRLSLRLLSLLRPHLGLVALALFLGALTGVAGIGLLATGGYLIAAAALGTPILALGIPIALVRVFGVGRGIVRYAERLSAHRVTFTLLTDLRVRCYQQLLRGRPGSVGAPARLGASRSGDVLTRLVKDVDDVQALYLRVCTPIIVALLLGILIVALFAYFSLVLGAVMLSFLLLAGVALPWAVYRRTRPAQESLVANRAALQAQVVEMVQGMADLLTFGGLRADPCGVTAIHALLDRSRQRLISVAGAQRFAITVLTGGALCTVLLLSLLLIGQGTLKAMYLPLLALVALVSFDAVQPLGEAVAALRSTTAAAARVYEVLDAEPAVAAPPQPRPPPTSVDVCFDHVTFAYQPGGPPALCDVTFHLPQGGRIAIVGPSGAGKTTLVNLLVRFRDPAGGAIRLGGHDLRTYALDDLRRSVGVVSQRTTIFSGTLRHNLLLARPGASDAELLEALARVGLAELPARSPLGLDRWVGEEGMQLSGGERQRLAIARTLLLDAPLLVLDEPTANLDPITERDLLAELAGTMAGRTTISITHRLIGLEGMDEILVLDAGGIVERGTHAQLAARDGLYRRMLDAQDQFVDAAGVDGRG